MARKPVAKKTYYSSSEYNRYLKSEHWRSFRLKIITDRSSKCEHCGKFVFGSDAQVHHKTYDRIGHERKTDVLLLCLNCHEKVHGRTFAESAIVTRIKELIRLLSRQEIANIKDYISKLK